MPIVAGTFFGLAMAVVSYFILGNTLNLLHPPTPGEILLIGILSGFFFGTLFTWMTRRKSRQIVDRLYSGDESLIVAPISDGAFAYRLPCTWIKDSLGFGGVLYAGRSELLFVPHKLNGRSISAIRMAPLEQLQVGVSKGPPSLNLVQRMLIPHPQPLLEIRWLSEIACFLVPSAATTANLLIQVLHDLKRDLGHQPDKS
jgi:hypothetical protein